MKNGTKLVCIDDVFDATARKLYTALPVKDETYTLRGMCPGINTNLQDDEIAIYLEELRNPCSTREPFREFGFKIERFVPLESETEEEVYSDSVTVGDGKRELVLK